MAIRRVRLIAVALLGATLISSGLGQDTATVEVEVGDADSPLATKLLSRKESKPRPVFLFYGDSITEFGADVSMNGWTALLGQTYVRSVDVINRGLSAYNTDQFIDLVLPGITDEIATQYKPALIALWLGTNDAALVSGPSANQHVAVDQYAKNLVVIVSQFKTLAPQAKIIVITPAVIDDDARLRAAGGGPVDRSNAVSKMYAAACAEAMKGLKGVTVLDLYTILMTTYPDAAVRATLLNDGLHLSARGNRVVYEHVNRLIRAIVSPIVLHTPQFPYV